MSATKVLIDALEFIKFTDRAIGNRFKECLNALDADMTDEEYVPSDSAEASYTKLAEEIEDAQSKEAEDEDIAKELSETPVIKETELPAEEEAADIPVIQLDPEDEDEPTK